MYFIFLTNYIMTTVSNSEIMDAIRALEEKIISLNEKVELLVRNNQVSVQVDVYQKADNSSSISREITGSSSKWCIFF